MPKAPTSPDVARNTAVGALLGLVIAAMIVILLAMIDTTIRSEEDLIDAFEIPILGVIPKLPEKEEGGENDAK